MALFRKHRYSDLLTIASYADRLAYLQLNDNHIFDETFGKARHLNQEFYQSQAWLRVRRDVIIRDNGCDLGIEGLNISKGIIVHHINPITLDDVLNEDPWLLDPENLICCTAQTHHAIHYGHDVSKPEVIIERQPYDTCPWR